MEPGDILQVLLCFFAFLDFSLGRSYRSPSGNPKPRLVSQGFPCMSYIAVSPDLFQICRVTSHSTFHSILFYSVLCSTILLYSIIVVLFYWGYFTVFSSVLTIQVNYAQLCSFMFCSLLLQVYLQLEYLMSNIIMLSHDYSIILRSTVWYHSA